MIHYYYSIISRKYVYKCLLLYNSMLVHDQNFRFFIICLQDEVDALMRKLGLKNGIIINIKEIEGFDRELPIVKNRRAIKQYAWAAKPSAALYIFENYPEVDRLSWLDGDTLFLSSPECIYKEWGDSSVLLTEESFNGKYGYLSKIYGYYNTGYMGFKKDEQSMECLEYFRHKLLFDWNYDKEEQYRWNDQLYVSDWKEKFMNIGVAENKGINLTPFVLNRLQDEEGLEVTKTNGLLYIGDINIVLFHYYGFIYFNEKEFELCAYTDISNAAEIEHIYLPYMKESVKAVRQINKIEKCFYKAVHTKGRHFRNYYFLDRI